MAKFTNARSAAGRCFRGAAGAAWVALAAYCLLSTVAGPAGLAAYGRLESQRSLMSENLDALGQANAKLRIEVESLRSDADRAAREARSLGYLRRGESAIVVAGRKDEVKALDAGTVLRFDAPSAWPDAVIKEIAFGVFLTVFAVFLAPRRSRSS